MKSGVFYPFYMDCGKMRAPISVCIVFLAFYAANIPHKAAAQPAIEWVKSIASNDYNAGTDIIVDINGDILIAGVYRDEIALDNNPAYRFSNQGKSDIVLIKMAPSGEVVWMRTLGGAGEDRAFRLASDQEGNVFITGSFERVIRFDREDESHTLESRGKEDIFLAKFDADGQIAWSVQGGGSRSDQGIGLALDEEGHVYTSGFFEETSVFGRDAQAQITSQGQLDAYVAKYHAHDGALLWAKSLGGAKRDVASGIATGAAGEVYITGVTRGPGVFQAVDAQRIHGTHGGQDDFFLARLTPEGVLDHVAYAGGKGFDAANAIDVDNQGNVYITGYFEDKAKLTDFNGHSFSIEGKSFDLFVTKFDATGSLLWAQSAGGDLWDNAYDVDVDNQGNVYVTGLFREAADFNGNDKTDVEGVGEANAFVARYGSDGRLQGLRTIDGAKSEGAGIATDVSGEVFLTGLFLQEAMFDGNAEMLSSTTFNSFIVKYGANGFENEVLPKGFLKDDQTAIARFQNYPNPFTSNTSIEIELTQTTQIRLIVHDALGRALQVLNNQSLNAGVYRYTYDASRLAPGTYFYTLQTPSSTKTRAMTLMH